MIKNVIGGRIAGITEENAALVDLDLCDPERLGGCGNGPGQQQEQDESDPAASGCGLGGHKQKLPGTGRRLKK